MLENHVERYGCKACKVHVDCRDGNAFRLLEVAPFHRRTFLWISHHGMALYGEMHQPIKQVINLFRMSRFMPHSRANQSVSERFYCQIDCLSEVSWWIKRLERRFCEESNVKLHVSFSLKGSSVWLLLCLDNNNVVVLQRNARCCTKPFMRAH